MAANKRKQDEKHLKLLREMVALPHNKQCYDCHQRGPTYVNMTIGSFVCTACSGLLRGLNPPHRVKSISMTSFTPDEMDFLRSRGNDFCKKVWLGLYDSRTNTEPDSKDEQKIRDFMSQKYEKKRWYVQPTELMHEEARKMNTPVKQENANSKPLRTLGNNIPNLLVSKSRPAATTVTLQSQPATNSVPAPSTHSATQRPSAMPVNSTPAVAPQAVAVQGQAPAKSSAMDLLGDLGGDPFAPAAPAPAPVPAPAHQTTTPSGGGGGFADFSSFNSSQPAAQKPTFPPPAGMLTPVGSSQSSTAPPTSGFASFPPTTASSSATTTPSQDKYAALADLDTILGGGSSQSQPVNWDGGSGVTSSSGGGGGGGSWGATAPSTQSNAFGVPGAFSSSSAETAVWRSGDQFQVSSPGDPFQAAPFPGNKASTNPFRTSPAGANPFGTSQSSTAPGSNPFGQSPVQPSGFGAFGTPPSNPPPTNNGFAAFGQVSAASSQPQQFGMQNGGFGTQAGGWGQPPASQAGFGTAPGGFGAPAPAMTAPGGFGKAQPPLAFPPQQQQFAGGWPSQPAGTCNPFMSAATQQPVPPRSGSTNPFL